MQKKYFLFLFSLVSIYTNAQITLTSSTHTPQINDSFNYIIDSNPAFDVSQSGENQTWDFSSTSGSTNLVSFINLSASSEPATFPLANLVSTSTNTNAESYLLNSSSGIAIEGLYAPGTARAIYTDNQEYIKFPITYNDVFNETFSGTLENIAASQTFDRTGTIEITADGYGDLILPYTTVNNVLRVKVSNTYTDVFMGFPVTSINDVIYLWYDALNKSHLASASEAYSGGSLISSQASYLAQSDLVLNVNHSNFTKNHLSIFPNPVDDFTIIKNNSFNIIPAFIYDTKGSLIKTIDIKIGENRIDTSNLLSGIYIIKHVIGSKLYVNRLMVK